ncbi:DUF4157 domain-containing protein [Streptomyces sp. Qhu-G9]|uniref:eCIS core domain-containing protein n=1 Tax=Streptomyces sp. Qhu-G9 TaxID=3452799 RepID=UPI0022ABD8DE|nr:DUF4157 domain-containing protein [Streptomyces aurantiacus]WAU82899.1 DUF4157 domain-containing protein [Streptomyces aurantiacus]
MHAFDHDRSGAVDQARGRSSTRPGATPLTGAWVRHLQRFASGSVGPQESDPGLQHAQVQRAAVERALASPGKPMESGLRSELEGRFGGADFSGVVVHDDAVAREAAAVLDAKAFVSGRHIVDGGDMNTHTWAHELAHWEEQQQGSVPGKDNGAGVQISHPSDDGERRADAKADQVMSGSPPVQRASTAGAMERERQPVHGAQDGCADGDHHGNGPAVQRYKVIRPGEANYPKKEPDSDGFFVSQDTNESGSWFDERSKEAPPKPHLVYAGAVPLAVSDSFELAAPYAGGGVEPKSFFASDSQIGESNQRLKGHITLSKTGRSLVFEGSGDRRTLWEVEPEVKEEKNARKPKGLEVGTPQRCNEMVEFVTGRSGMKYQIDKPYWTTVEKFLHRMEGKKKWLGRFDKAVGSGDIEEFNQVTFKMSDRFQKLVRDNPKKAESVLAELEANEHAAIPRVNDAMVVTATPNEEQNKIRQDAQKAGRGGEFMDYHFGGVVAVSGGDYITMENYAREQHEDSMDTKSKNDPLWYFRMYGQQSQQTWHELWAGSNTSLLGAKLTITLRG